MLNVAIFQLPCMIFADLFDTLANSQLGALGVQSLISNYEIIIIETKLMSIVTLQRVYSLLRHVAVHKLVVTCEECSAQKKITIESLSSIMRKY